MYSHHLENAINRERKKGRWEDGKRSQQKSEKPQSQARFLLYCNSASSAAAGNHPAGLLLRSALLGDSAEWGHDFAEGGKLRQAVFLGLFQRCGNDSCGQVGVEGVLSQSWRWEQLANTSSTLTFKPPHALSLLQGQTLVLPTVKTSRRENRARPWGFLHVSEEAGIRTAGRWASSRSCGLEQSLTQRARSALDPCVADSVFTK